MTVQVVVTIVVNSTLNMFCDEEMLPLSYFFQISACNRSSNDSKDRKDTTNAFCRLPIDWETSNKPVLFVLHTN